MNKLTTQRNFHVPLPDTLYRQLRQESQHSGQPATNIAREAIEYWLEPRRRSRVAEEIAAYIEVAAGTQDDLDSGLEAESIQCWLEEDKG